MNPIICSRCGMPIVASKRGVFCGCTAGLEPVYPSFPENRFEETPKIAFILFYLLIACFFFGVMFIAYNVITAL